MHCSFFFLVQYLTFLYQYIQEWLQNPHWSFSCCLAFLLPLNDLQGEIRGMAGTNVLNTQLQTGGFAQPSISSFVNDSGALRVTLSGGEGQLCDDDKDKSKRRNYKVAKYSKAKRDQGTQTEASALLGAAIMVRESLESTHQKFLLV